MVYFTAMLPAASIFRISCGAGPWSFDLLASSFHDPAHGSTAAGFCARPKATAQHNVTTKSESFLMIFPPMSGYCGNPNDQNSCHLATKELSAFFRISRALLRV